MSDAAADLKSRARVSALLLVALLGGLVAVPLLLPDQQLAKVARSVRVLGVLSWYLLLLVLAGAALHRLAPATGQLGPASLRLVRWGSGAALWSVLFLVLLSWLSYSLSGLFLNWEMVAFFFGNLALVLTYLEPLDWLGIVGAALGALVLFWPARALLGRAAAWVAQQGARPALAVAGLAAAGLTFSFVLFPAATGDRMPPPETRRTSGVVAHSTPEIAFAASALARLRDLGGAVGVAQVLEPRSGVQRLGELEVELSPRHAAGHYLEQVDLARVRPLDVVLIVVESLRGDAVRIDSASGPSLARAPGLMPFVDSLVGQGWVFSHAYSQGSETRYGLSSLLSSLYPLRGSSTNLFDSPAAPRLLLYEPLKAIGYRTAVFASSDEGWGNLAAFYRSDNLDLFFHSRDFDGPKLTGDFIDDRVTTERYLAWLGDGPPEAPAFAYLMLTATHFPYELAYDMATPFTPNEVASASFLHYPEADCEAMRNRYRNSVRFIDQRIRELFAGIAELGRIDRTLFVITGDHGEAFCERGEITHGKNLYEPAVRVPLLIVGPADIVPQQIEARPVQHLDVAPTVLALLGLPPHPNFQGLDLRSAELELDQRKLFLSVQHLGFQDALVWRGLKLLRDSRGRGLQLYDLTADPGELAELSAHRPEQVEAYRSILEQWRAAQMAYYGHRDLQRLFYPPRYR